MRTLNFNTTNEADNKERYDLLYEAFAGTTRPIGGAEVRVCARIFTKFEELGKLSEEKMNGQFIYIFGRPGIVQLEEPEFKLFKECVSSVKWNALGARKAAPILEWVEMSKEE